MNDTYQPIYDAIRSRIGHANIEEAVRQTLNEANLSFYAERAANAACDVMYEQARPSVIFRPKLALDGNKWIACYGDNLQEGVVGIGDSPAEAMSAFDIEWYKKQTYEGVE